MAKQLDVNSVERFLGRSKDFVKNVMNQVISSKLYLFICLILICISLTYCNSCTKFNEFVGLPDDHPAEQILEKYIDEIVEDQTGIDPDIDLTP